MTDGRGGGARGGSGHAPILPPHHPRRGRPRRRARLRLGPGRAGLLGGRRPPAGQRRPLLGRPGRPLLGHQLGRALRRAAHAVGRRQARSPRPRSQRPARAPDRRCARVLPAVRRDRPAALEGRPDARAGLRLLDAHASAPTSTWSSTARSSTASATRGSPGASSASPTTRRDAIADRIHRTAMGSYWRWPTIRLNQINWYALVYAANATVTGSPRLLRHDLRLQIERFAARARGSAGVAGNLGAGLHFNYLPHLRPLTPMNTDSAEYANITASFTREYAQARRAGMRPPSPGTTRLMRQWLMRVLDGLLDPRRLRELGHGLRLPALAPVEEARAQPAGADRDRDGARARAAPERARVGEVDARPRLRVLRARARARGRRAARPLLRRPRAPAAGRERAAGARADVLQRGASGRGRARLGARQGAAAAVRVRPRHRTAGRHDARLQHRDRAEQPRRVSRTAASTSPGSTTAARRSRPGSAGARRRPSGCSCATSRAGAPSRASCPTAAGCGSRRRRTASAPAAPRGTGRAYAGPFQDLRAAGFARGARLAGAHQPSLHALLRADDLDAAAGGGAGPRERRRPVPELGLRRAR